MPERVIKEIILGEEFIFDYTGYQLFHNEFTKSRYNPYLKEEFKVPPEIIIDNGYLARRYGSERIDYFHRWFKKKKKDIGPDEVVHHRNENKHDNRSTNLYVKEVNKHKEDHLEKLARVIQKKKYSNAYNTFKKKYFLDHPDDSYAAVNYYWKLFKEKHEISKELEIEKCPECKTELKTDPGGIRFGSELFDYKFCSNCYWNNKKEVMKKHKIRDPGYSGFYNQ